MAEPVTDNRLLMETIHFPAIILVGPTAIGKTSLALRLAAAFDCEIVSVDSMQIYRRLDIGTAKPTAGERAATPHHLIDIVEPEADYTAADFARDGLKAVAEITGRQHVPLLTGGTGLYLKVLLEGLFQPGETGEETETSAGIRAELKKRLAGEGRERLHGELRLCDPESAVRIHPHDTQRLLRALEVCLVTGTPLSDHLRDKPRVADPEREGYRQCLRQHGLRLGLTCDREELYRRIDARTGIMVEAGLLEEVRGLLAMGYGAELKSMQAIGYRHMVEYLAGLRSWEETVQLLARDTRRYAKRQYTWFRNDPAITWFDRSREEEIVDFVARYLEKSEE